MKHLFYFILLSFTICSGTITAQGVRGKVVDRDDQPIESVAVILQSTDSLFIDAVVTDSTGYFEIPQSIDSPHYLIFQHLLFETFQKTIGSGEVGTVQLAAKDFELDEVVVKGERPLVKVEGGALTYDIPQLIQNKTSTNAFEAIKELPGITGADDEIELVGARSLNIIINGQLTSMTLPQLIQLLKTMPASRVQSAEVMYNAPARYNVKGALINVVLDQEVSDTPNFQGEAGADYTQRRYASGEAHTNLLYSTPKLSVDLLVNGGRNQNYSGEKILARHTLDDDVIEVDQYGIAESRNWNGTARMGIDYTFSNNDKLSGSYYYNGRKSSTERNSTTTFTPFSTNIPSVSKSKSEGSGRTQLHNAHLQYDGHQGLSAGADYTRYSKPDDLYFFDRSDTGAETNMFYTTKQDVSRYTLFINQTHSIGSWTINYGAQGGFAKSDNILQYYYDRGEGYQPDLDSFEDNTQKDYTANVFAEVSTNFGEKLTATVGLKGEYFKSDYHSAKENKTLWNQWTLFPTVSLSYTASPYNIFQLNVSSEKTYPDYWALSPQRYPMNSYSEIVGNPELKPYRSYDMQLVYIMRQKYVFLLFCTYEPDYFAQVPYQSDESLKNVFRFENFDFAMKTGFAAIIPFKVGSFWDSRVTINGFRMQEKNNNFHGMKLNREAYIAALNMNNTFNLSSKPNIKLTVDGSYVSPGAIQGVFDLGYLYQVSAGLKWTSESEKTSLTLKVNDIFQSGFPNELKVNEGTQWSRMKMISDNRYVQASFVYKFGGYKEKKHKAVDTSRF